MSRLIALAALALLAFGVAGLSSADVYQDAAADVCDCQSHLHAKSKEMAEAVKKAQATGNFQEIMRIQGEMMGMQGEIEACYAKLPEKYPDLAKDQSKIDKVNDLAEEKCPNPGAAMLRGGN